MDGPTTIPLVCAIAIPNMFLWTWFDQRIKSQTEELLAGAFVRSLSLAERRADHEIELIVAPQADSRSATIGR